jgi:hypothetical protein
MTHTYTGTLPEPPKPRRGRPPGTGTGKLRETSSLSLPAPLWGSLRELANQRAQPLSRCIEELLQEAIKPQDP